MRGRTFLPALIIALVLLLGVSTAFASNPIPGVGIVIKQCKCPPSWKCCGAVTARTTAGQFGPGSDAFDGTMGLMGRCSHDCGGCDDDCAGSPGNPDGHMDFAADSPAGPFDISMAPMTLYSIEPIRVSINGADSFFDMFVTLTGQQPLPDAALTGSLSLTPGERLDVGGASRVGGSSIDLHCTITFADAATGMPAGPTLEQDLHLTLQDAELPIARVADGSATGRIVLGPGIPTTVPFSYASAGGELTLEMRSLYPDSPVAVHARTWGSLKTLYR